MTKVKLQKFLLGSVVVVYLFVLHTYISQQTNNREGSSSNTNLFLNPNFEEGLAHWKPFHWPNSLFLEDRKGRQLDTNNQMELLAAPHKHLVIHFGHGKLPSSRGVWQYIDLQSLLLPVVPLEEGGDNDGVQDDDERYLYQITLEVSVDASQLMDGSFAAYLDVKAIDGQFSYDHGINYGHNTSNDNNGNDRCYVFLSQKPLEYAMVFLLLQGTTGIVKVYSATLYYERILKSTVTKSEINHNGKTCSLGGATEAEVGVGTGVPPPKFISHDDYDKHLFFSKASHAASIISNAETKHVITVFTQMSVDRFPRLSLLSRHWDGLISVAVLVRNSEELNTLKEFQKDSRYSHVANNVDIHLLYSDGNAEYPINALRNLALDTVRPASKYVISLDVDFIPNHNAYSILRELLANVQTLDGDKTGEELIGFVLPAFEIDGLTPISAPSLLPPSKEDLLPLIRNNIARQVHVNFAPEVQSATMYSKWETSTDIYQIEYILHYEPFILAHKDTFLRYDTRFKGYGFDKASHTYEMVRRGGIFYVLPDCFIVHVDHEEQVWKAHVPHITTRVWMNSYAFMVEIEKSKHVALISQNKDAPQPQPSLPPFHFNQLKNFNFIDWTGDPEAHALPPLQHKSVKLKKIGLVCCGIIILTLAYQVFLKDRADVTIHKTK